MKPIEFPSLFSLGKISCMLSNSDLAEVAERLHSVGLVT